MQQTSSYSLEEGDNELEGDDPPLLEVPRTLRVAFAATATSRKQQQLYFLDQELILYHYSAPPIRTLQYTVLPTNFFDTDIGIDI